MTAIVLAAGKGARMHSKIQKQYMSLLGRPVITYPLETFEQSPVDEVILVVAPGETEFAQKNILEPYGYHKVSKVVTGGKERYHSVYYALCAIEEAMEDDHYVLIHDGARAFITPERIEYAISCVKKDKACVMGMPVKDTIKIVDEECYALSTPKRSAMWQVQTPQCFLLSEIREAYRKMLESGDTSATDDGMVMERYGNRRVRMIEGSYENMKITTPEDLLFGEAILHGSE